MSTPQPPMLERSPRSLRVARRYDRGFDWTYAAPPPGPEASSGALLVPVYWDGVPLNGGDDPSGLCAVVENVTGWLDSPPLDGHDASRVISDGAAWGPKTLGARIITISGVATGPRPLLGAFRDQLVALACAREPAPLAITDSGVERTLTALVRADSDAWKQTWVTPTCWRYQVTLTAADPALYEDTWQTVTLNLGLSGATGRTYQKPYSWQYASPYLPNSAMLTNDGNVDAPVYALYTGDISQSQLADEDGDSIGLAALTAGAQIWVDTSTLTAQAAGGLSRASFILPGSDPMTIPALSTVRWHLYATGGGSVALAWRSAWV